MRFFQKQSILVLATFAVAAIISIQVSNAQAPLNRDQRALLVTHPGAGALGADESRLQTVTLAMETIGFGAQFSVNNRIVEDVTFSSPTHIDVLTMYSYQTSSTTTSTFNDLRVQIYDGAPNAGGTVILGDMTTNRFATSAFTNIYRVTETAVGNTMRPIMSVSTVDLDWDLAPGTYWIEFQFGGSLTSGPWAPPISILGVNGEPGANALQGIPDTVTPTIINYNLATDGGTGNPPQGFPISIVGTQGENVFANGFEDN